MPELIDVSPRLHAGLAVWPGDTRFGLERLLRLADGDPLELSALRSTVHAGAHADAPSHFRPGAPAIDRLPLAPYFGPCRLIDAAVGPRGRVRPADLAAEVDAPRVLIRTGTRPDPDRWSEDFAGLSVELVRHLGERGVVLAGIDTPSMDPFADPAIPAHHALAEHGIAILEGLDLAGVPAGRYTLAAFPLRLAGAEASPVRAVLIR